MTMLAVPPADATTSAEPRPRFRDLLAAEWLKLRSLRSAPWSFLIAAPAVLAFNVGAAYDHSRYWSENEARDRARFLADGMPLLDAFTTNAGMIMMLAAGAIGALAITGEYGTGLIRTTFAAVPARRSVMAAKVCVVAAVMTVFGAVVAAVSFAATQAILSGRHAGVPIGHPGALRVVVASALLAPSPRSSAWRSAPSSGTARRRWSRAWRSWSSCPWSSAGTGTGRPCSHALPFKAWMRLVDVNGDAGAAFPWSLSGAWTVYAVWALAAGAVAVTAVHRRDE